MLSKSSLLFSLVLLLQRFHSSTVLSIETKNLRNVKGSNNINDEVLFQTNPQHKRKLQVDPDSYVSKLRVLTFGASLTWGSTLKDRFASAYPYLLSPNTTNLAIRATGPNYPSICTQSMVGDDAVYDVIILEYLRAGEGLDVLATRLRQRFPDALIIFLFTWNPALMEFFDVNDDKQRWIRKHEELGLANPNNSPTQLGHIHKGVIDAISPQVSRYSVMPTLVAEWMEENNRIMKSVNGHSIYWNTEGESKEWFEHKLSLFNDKVHLNEQGHHHIYWRIRALIEDLKPVPSNKLGSWGEGDSCQTWFLTGETTIQYSDSIKMNQFKDGKNALEVPFQGGELIVDNPFPTPRELLISCMATGPADTIYPDARVIIVGKNHTQTNYIHPLATEFNFPVHVSITRAVGFIGPGRNVVHIRPTKESENLFRITAIAIVGKNTKPLASFTIGQG